MKRIVLAFLLLTIPSVAMAQVRTSPPHFGGATPRTQPTRTERVRVYDRGHSAWVWILRGVFSGGYYGYYYPTYGWRMGPYGGYMYNPYNALAARAEIAAASASASLAATVAQHLSRPSPYVDVYQDEEAAALQAQASRMAIPAPEPVQSTVLRAKIDKIKACKVPGDEHYMNGELDPADINFSQALDEMRKRHAPINDQGIVRLYKGAWICGPHPAGREFPGDIYETANVIVGGVVKSVKQRVGLYIIRVPEGFLYTVNPPSGEEAR